MLACLLAPAPELRARGPRAGGIVRETKTNQIDMYLWWIGHKIIFCGAGQIEDPFVAAVFPAVASVAGHHVCIDIDRINRIGDRHLVLIAENIEDVTAIAF